MRPSTARLTSLSANVAPHGGERRERGLRERLLLLQGANGLRLRRDARDPDPRAFLREPGQAVPKERLAAHDRLASLRGIEQVAERDGDRHVGLVRPLGVEPLEDRPAQSLGRRASTGTCADPVPRARVQPWRRPGRLAGAVRGRPVGGAGRRNDLAACVLDVPTASRAAAVSSVPEASGRLVGPPVFKTGVGARAPRRVRFPSASASQKGL